MSYFTETFESILEFKSDIKRHYDSMRDAELASGDHHIGKDYVKNTHRIEKSNEGPRVRNMDGHKRNEELNKTFADATKTSRAIRSEMRQQRKYVPDEETR